MPGDTFFSAELLFEDLWAISGPVNDLMYLVLGDESGLLVDTGMGVGNLLEFTRTLTDLPLTVVNTHGHPDHGGGNGLFEEVWLHPADYAIMREMCATTYRENDLKAMLGEQSELLSHFKNNLTPFRPVRLQEIRIGQVFDLGGRKFEVLGLPGHTPGSICLFDPRENLLFMGDSAVATPVWLYLEYSEKLDIYLQGLKKLNLRIENGTILFPGHLPGPLNRAYLLDLIKCVEEVVLNPGLGTLTKTFVGEGLLWEHGRGQIIYNPKNIKSP